MNKKRRKIAENLKGKRKYGAKLPLTLEQYKTIRKLIRGSKQNKYAARNLLLINFQLNSSFRASDILSLKIKDIFDNGRYLPEIWRKQQKTKDPNIIKITPVIIEDLNAAQLAYHDIFMPGYFNNPDLPLFPSKRKNNGKFKALDYSTYLYYLKGWIAEAGLNPDLYGTHSLRSAIPVDYYSQTGDLLTASHMFGHLSSATTQIYVNKVAKKKAADIRELYQFKD